MTKGKTEMVIRSINVSKELWDNASQKAKDNAQSLSAVLRRLIEMWINDEIDITKRTQK